MDIYSLFVVVNWTEMSANRTLFNCLCFSSLWTYKWVFGHHLFFSNYFFFNVALIGTLVLLAKSLSHMHCYSGLNICGAYPQGLSHTFHVTCQDTFWRLTLFKSFSIKSISLFCSLFFSFFSNQNLFWYVVCKEQSAYPKLQQMAFSIYLSFKGTGI